MSQKQRLLFLNNSPKNQPIFTIFGLQQKTSTESYNPSEIEK